VQRTIELPAGTTERSRRNAAPAGHTNEME